MEPMDPRYEPRVGPLEFWSAPIADYNLPFVAHEQFGYIMSAVVGPGVIILVFVFVGVISERLRKRNSAT